MVTADEEEKAPPVKAAMTKKSVSNWERLNTQNAIWLRDSNDVTDEEYEKFYQAMSKVCHQRPSREFLSHPLHAHLTTLRSIVYQ